MKDFHTDKTMKFDLPPRDCLFSKRSHYASFMGVIGCLFGSALPHIYIQVIDSQGFISQCNNICTTRGICRRHNVGSNMSYT